MCHVSKYFSLFAFVLFVLLFIVFFVVLKIMPFPDLSSIFEVSWRKNFRNGSETRADIYLINGSADYTYEYD